LETATPNTAAAAAAVPIPTNELPIRHSAKYVGEDALAGFEATDLLLGEYWEQNGTFLFEPSGSGKIFEVSDTDIVRTSV
jgi:hypothetical protein